ncbi:ribosomal 40S subunit protein S27A [Rhizophlyctis rosea]|uniref:Ribosomal 40S subunit protein S27A n=1 Tax=Rhizophlyctis rosea TaxID=64517 RepID=A0AAD5S385_9FUNG|nr:ribosomal 40S subunit protein S27A [Rhizophlyctis rosea]
MCDALGLRIDHNPLGPHDDELPRKKRRLATLIDYENYFKEKPPAEIWGIEEWEFDTPMEGRSIIQDREGIPSDQQRVLDDHVQLKDECELGDYGIKEGSELHLVLRLRGC